MYSATRPLGHSATRPLGHSATRPLGHSATVFIALIASSSSWASEENFDDRHLLHPLLSQEVSDIVASSTELSDEELLSELLVYETTIELGETTEATFGARFKAVGEPLPEELARPRSAELPFHKVFDPVVNDWLSGALPDDEEVDVIVSFRRELWDETVSVPHQQNLAMLRGEASSRADLDAVRDAVLEDRRLAGEEGMSGALALVEDSQGEVLAWSPTTGSARFLVSVAALAELATLPEVAALEPWSDDDGDDAAGISTTVTGSSIDGSELQDLLQVVPFYLRGYFGRNQEWIGLVEKYGHEIHTEHVSFENGSGTRRVEVCQGTHATVCTVATVTASPNSDHATGTASVLMSDLTLGQDPDFTGIAAQRKRSGVARRGKVLGMSKDDTGRVASVMSAHSVKILNMSSSTNADPLCLGADGTSRDWNAMYESGIALFNSTGNQGQVVGNNDCLVWSPGSAIGVFTVNAYTVDGATPSNEGLYSGSAQGGFFGPAAEGANRTIIDMLGPSDISLRAVDDSSLSPQYRAEGGGDFCCTSSATPTIAGAAALFRDWYLAEKSSLIDDPGILYANLLLMGDGMMAFGSGLYDRIGYHSRYGAGIFRLRAFDGEGLDGPAQWMTGSVCVDDGEVVTVDLNQSAPLPSGVDYIKATTWTYDHDHDDVAGNGHDEFGLRLRRLDSGTWSTAVTDDSADNKHRVFYDGTDISSAEAWRLRIYGADVTSDNEGCGTDSNRVFYALLWEDNARDDDSTLTTYVRPEP